MADKKFPIATWTQPVRNLLAQAALGVTVVWGPEIESGSGVTAQQWCDAALAAKLQVITKNQTLPVPVNCVGFWHARDEPNQTGPGHVEPEALAAEYARLKLLAPNLPVWLSLAGDKIVYENFPTPADRDLYLRYGKVCDKAMFNFYSKNRSDKYPTSMTALAVKNWINLVGKPAGAWIEINDQELGAPQLPEINRAPTPTEEALTVKQAIDAGAESIGWFGVCKRATRHGWPAQYWPPTDRNGVSMQPNYDMLKVIAANLNPSETLDQRVKDLEEWRATYFKT